MPCAYQWDYDLLPGSGTIITSARDMTRLFTKYSLQNSSKLPLGELPNGDPGPTGGSLYGTFSFVDQFVVNGQMTTFTALIQGTDQSVTVGGSPETTGDVLYNAVRSSPFVAQLDRMASGRDLAVDQ